MKIIDGNFLKTMIVNGAQALINDIDRINALNVFPVPDGDTGTNMRLTIEGGVREIASLNEENLGIMFKTMSRGMTMSARGNSGVILSQFFKGMSVVLENSNVADADSLTQAFRGGVEQAYKVVQKPTEGTILTVMREACEHVENKKYNSIDELLVDYLEAASLSLSKTPELLPILKEAGVIDSGGAGFVRIFEGILSAIDGNLLADVSAYVDSKNNKRGSFGPDSVLEYGYCTEFILQLQNAKVDIASFDIQKEIMPFLESIGNSIVAFKDDDIVKVHVHTMTPGKVVEYCQQFGEYVTFKMENMSVQHSELEEIIPTAMEKVHKEIALVAVSSGEGIDNQFKALGVDEIVSGGQSMNPSTEDFIAAFDKLDATNIIVFPNNGNIIMAANMAAANYDKANVVVIPTKSIVVCHAALTMIDLSQDLETVIDDINMSIDNVIACEVTYAIRDCNLDGHEVKKGQYIALSGKSILANEDNKVTCVLNMIKNIEDIESKEVITIFYGQDVKEEEVNAIVEGIGKICKFADVPVINGKQDVYSFLISVE